MAAVDWLARQRGARPDRIAGFGMSLGGEVLLEAAARDRRLAAVIADGAERASDDRLLHVDAGRARVAGAAANQAIRAISGMREAPPLVRLLPRVAPRPVLLIAAGGRPHELPVNRAYRRAAGAGAELWLVPRAAHTGAIRARPAEYEQRTIGFLRRTLDGR